MGIEAIFLVLASVFLGYQNLGLFGRLGALSRISVAALDRHVLLNALGFRVSYWGIILGACGLVVVVIGFLEGRHARKPSTSRFTWSVTILYAVLALITLF